MDWGDLGLRMLRAAGAIVSVLAGIAALLTEGAFTKRDPPISGRWKDFPFSKYKVTPWGAILLAIILLAPTVQFIGDWVKDAQDAKTLQATIDKLKREVNGTVTASTTQSRADIERTVHDASEAELAAAKKVLSEQQSIGAQTSTIASGASHILEGVQRIIGHFDQLTVDVIYEYPTKDALPGMRRLTAVFDKLVDENSRNDMHDWPDGLGLRGNGAHQFWGLWLHPSEYSELVEHLNLGEDQATHTAAYYMTFSNPGLAIAFTKSARPTATIKDDLFDNLEQADLVGRSSQEPSSPDHPPRRPEVQYSQRSGRIFLELRGYHVLAKDWKTNGNFGATTDLGGAYVYVMPDDGNYSQQWEHNQLLAHIKPIWMSIYVSNLVVEITQFTRVRDLPIFVARLPTNGVIFAGKSSARTPDIDDKVSPP
jgi:hypothetical protein